MVEYYFKEGIKESTHQNQNGCILFLMGSDVIRTNVMKEGIYN